MAVLHPIDGRDGPSSPNLIRMHQRFLSSAVLLLASSLAGCPETHSPTDGGATDAPLTIDAGLLDGGAFDAGGASDILVDANLPGAPGRTLVLRVWDNVLPSASAWQTLPIDGAGRVSVRLSDAMPSDVFGVFVQYYIDTGDGLCDGDPAFEVFVSNAFVGDVPLSLDANPDTTTTCANATRSP